MNERWLVSSFTASSLIHLGIIPLAALVMHAKPIKPAMVPIELVDVPRVEEPKKVEVAPPPPPPKPKNITAPKLLSKPVLETRPAPLPGEAGGTAAAGHQRRRQGRLERRLEGGRGGRQRRGRRQSFWQRRRRRGGRQRCRRRRRRKRNSRVGARRSRRRHRRGSAFGPGSASRRLSSQAALSGVGAPSGRAGRNHAPRAGARERPGCRSDRRPVGRISRSRYGRHATPSKNGSSNRRGKARTQLRSGFSYP